MIEKQIIYMTNLSIYIKKNVCLFVCLFVLYAFSPCNSYGHQTFYNASLGPKEGRRWVSATIWGWGREPGWNFTQAVL